jgi:hypothetical protein
LSGFPDDGLVLWSAARDETVDRERLETVKRRLRGVFQSN